MTTYVPIDCNFYDRILEASTLQQSVELVYQDEEIRTIEVIIQDVYTNTGEEFLRTSSGLVIRLDQIVRLGNHFLPQIDQFGQHYSCLRPIAIT